MQKSLFKKFFGFSMLLTLMAMVIMGSMLLGFAGNNWMQEKERMLQSEALSIADEVTKMESTGYFTGLQVISGIAKGSGNNILVVRPDGKVWISDRESLNKTVPEEMLSQVTLGWYSGKGNLGGILSEPCKIVGVPAAYQGESYSVFVAMPMQGFYNYIFNMLRIFIVAALVVVTLVFIAVYFMSISMVRPVRAMAEAARCMSRGDFSRRIPVDREDEIGELAVAFNNMTMSIAAGESMRRGFIANVSHELKTPMTTISGFIDGILDGTISQKEQTHYLEIVSQEVKRLSRLVVSMLSLSKLEAGEMKIKPAPTKLTNTLFNVLLGFEKRIEEHDLQILGMDEMESVTVMADPDLLHQVVYNLVENAIKYTPQGGYIRMQVSREDGRITLTIRNSGKGIPKKDLPHVFERFYKADKSRGTDKSGSGLGLYLVKTIISLHGGQITVRSVEGEYCEFAFTLEEYRKTASGESSKADETGTDSKGEGKLKQGTSRRGAGKDDSSHE